jgi:hypothetical protein
MEEIEAIIFKGASILAGTIDSDESYKFVERAVIPIAIAD